MKIAANSFIYSIPAISLTEAQKTLWGDWIKALRSGEYEQGVGALRSSGNKFCCLGVLSDVAHPEQWMKDGELEGDYRHGMGVCQSPSYGALNPFLAREAGIKILGFPVSARLQVKGEPMFFSNISLTALNDHGVPFGDIADILEKAMNGGYEHKLKAVA